MKDSSENRKASIGIILTLVYATVYCGFITLNIFWPTWMEIDTVFGLNLAVFYGKALIALAIALALVYNRLCRHPKPGQKIDMPSMPGPKPEGRVR